MPYCASDPRAQPSKHNTRHADAVRHASTALCSALRHLLDSILLPPRLPSPHRVPHHQEDGGNKIESSKCLRAEHRAVEVNGQVPQCFFGRCDLHVAEGYESSPSPPPPGRIVSISSQAAHAALHRHGAYCASKAGLLGLTRSMASEWGGRGITANTVSGGGGLGEDSAALEATK
jgi:NAD(P)-dependent dehydrogenase (short-subunit alcohol dehydrogenase family)